MPRVPIITYDRGTLLIHPPPRGRKWIEYATWDDRVEKFRVLAIDYRSLVETLIQEEIEFEDRAKGFEALTFETVKEIEPYPHQQEALAAWKAAKRRGVVVLPTGAGKTYLAQMAIVATPRPTLIVVPTIELMHQWYAHLNTVFTGVEIGLLGGGAHDRTPILVATYDSAAIHIEKLGNLYATIVFDECHHLPAEFYNTIASFAIAPYRLGLTATPERGDGKHLELVKSIGPEIYRKTPAELAGTTLAPYKIEQIKVKLTNAEQNRYQELIAERNRFLASRGIYFSSPQGWQDFVRESGRSSAGRRAMLAHREAKEIVLCTNAKLRILADLLAKHYPEPTLIFTSDNATVYRIAQTLLIPAITHHTPVKERHVILGAFRSGEYKTLVASQVLNEGIDIPAAKIAIVLSGSASPREHVQRLGRILRKGDGKKHAILYELISADTMEERTSDRRNQTANPPQLAVVPTQAARVSRQFTAPKVAEDGEDYEF
jgi:superfamily II DNA or RNA helicase